MHREIAERDFVQSGGETSCGQQCLHPAVLTAPRILPPPERIL